MSLRGNGPGRLRKSVVHLLKNGRASGAPPAPDGFEACPPRPSTERAHPGSLHLLWPICKRQLSTIALPGRGHLRREGRAVQAASGSPAALASGCPELRLWTPFCFKESTRGEGGMHGLPPHVDGPFSGPSEHASWSLWVLPPHAKMHALHTQKAVLAT